MHSAFLTLLAALLAAPDHHSGTSLVAVLGRLALGVAVIVAAYVQLRRRGKGR